MTNGTNKGRPTVGKKAPKSSTPKKATHESNRKREEKVIGKAKEKVAGLDSQLKDDISKLMSSRSKTVSHKSTTSRWTTRTSKRNKALLAEMNALIFSKADNVDPLVKTEDD